jgi:hypothetical protein
MVIPAGRPCGVVGNAYRTCVGGRIRGQCRARNMGKDKPFKQRFQSYLGRLDYQLSEKNNFYFRYSEFMTPSQYNTSGGLLTKSASNNFNDRNDTASSQWTNIISPNLVNELRFGFLRREFTRPPVSGTIGPIILINGVAQLGSNSSAGQYYEKDQFNFIGNVR